MNMTYHAYERGKERMGLGDRAIQRMAERAFEKGISVSETTGRFRRYLERLYDSHGNGNNLRVYGEKIFVFQNETLITILHLPNDYKKAAKKLFDARGIEAC